jgi:hypothetical protein
MKKIIGIITISMGILLLGACTSEQATSTQPAVKIKEGSSSVTYPLDYVDTQTTTTNSKTTSVLVVAYLQDNKEKTFRLTYDNESGGFKSKGYEYTEHIEQDASKEPYVKLSKAGSTTKIDVYRQPYTRYNQPTLAGTVTDKETTSSSSSN